MMAVHAEFIVGIIHEQACEIGLHLGRLLKDRGLLDGRKILRAERISLWLPCTFKLLYLVMRNLLLFLIDFGKCGVEGWVKIFGRDAWIFYRLIIDKEQSLLQAS